MHAQILGNIEYELISLEDRMEMLLSIIDIVNHTERLRSEVSAKAAHVHELKKTMNYHCSMEVLLNENNVPIKDYLKTLPSTDSSAPVAVETPAITTLAQPKPGAERDDLKSNVAWTLVAHSALIEGVHLYGHRNWKPLVKQFKKYLGEIGPKMCLEKYKSLIRGEKRRVVSINISVLFCVCIII